MDVVFERSSFMKQLNSRYLLLFERRRGSLFGHFQHRWPATHFMVYRTSSQHLPFLRAHTERVQRLEVRMGEFV